MLSCFDDLSRTGSLSFIPIFTLNRPILERPLTCPTGLPNRHTGRLSRQWPMFRGRILCRLYYRDRASGESVAPALPIQSNTDKIFLNSALSLYDCAYTFAAHQRYLIRFFRCNACTSRRGGVRGHLISAQHTFSAHDVAGERGGCQVGA